jgi:hypothetical protein
MQTLEEVLSPAPAPSLRLWRYLDTPKFLRMLQTKSLWFSRLDCLGDPFEGSMPRRLHERREALEASPELRSIDAETRAGLRSGAYANCWHANAVESTAMWTLYGGAGAAIAVTTTVERLRSVLPFMAYIAGVKYVDYAEDEFDDEHPLNRLVHKRKSFEHEREVRALILDFRSLPGGPDPETLCGHPQFDALDAATRSGGLEFSTDLNALIEGIRVSPSAPSWFEEVIQKAAGDAGLTVPVAKSELDSPALF